MTTTVTRRPEPAGAPPGGGSRRLTERVLSRKMRGNAEARVNAWVQAAGKDLAHWQRTLADMRAAGAGDFATLTVGVESVRKLAN